MIDIEHRLQVFIVRIWFEPREIEGAPEKMRGVIEHITTGQKHYFTTLEKLTELISHYLNHSSP